MANKTSIGLLKEFAMSNQLLENDLNRMEQDYKIDLGRHSQIDEWEERYYPQFDQLIRTEASQMSNHYRTFYCLEKTIRKLISESLEQRHGANWWDKDCIPEKIHTDVANRMQREIDSAITIRSEDHIDFTTFGELSEIIKNNWEVFGGMFNSRRAVERVLTNLNLLRGPIAHCSSLAEDEVIRLELSLRDWFRLME